MIPKKDDLSDQKPPDSSIYFCETCSIRLVVCRSQNRIKRHRESEGHKAMERGGWDMWRCHHCERPLTNGTQHVHGHRKRCAQSIHTGPNKESPELLRAKRGITTEGAKEAKIRLESYVWRSNDEELPTTETPPAILLQALKQVRSKLRRRDECDETPKAKRKKTATDDKRYGVYARVNPGNPFDQPEFGKGTVEREVAHSAVSSRYGGDGRRFIWIMQGLSEDEAFNGESICIELQAKSETNNLNYGQQKLPCRRLGDGRLVKATCGEFRAIWSTLFVDALQREGLI